MSEMCQNKTCSGQCCCFASARRVRNMSCSTHLLSPVEYCDLLNHVACRVPLLFCFAPSALRQPRLVTPDSDSVSTPQLPARRSRASPNPTVPFDSAQTSSGTGDTDVGSTGKFSTGAVTMGIDEGSVVTSAEALGGFAPHWVFLYQRLSTEGDRRVSEQSYVNGVTSTWCEGRCIHVRC